LKRMNNCGTTTSECDSVFLAEGGGGWGILAA